MAEITVKRVTDHRYEKFIADIASRPVIVPEWTQPTESKGKMLVVPTAFMSDTHFDEVVDPAQINGANAYNRKIAESRLKEFFLSTIKLGHQYFSGLTYPGIVIPLGGDMFSGNIHDELLHTNEATICESILHWIGPMVSGLQLAAEAYGRVYVPGVVGNHPRTTKKPVHKDRVRDNFDWLFYQLLARELSGDKRITFHISDAPDFGYSIFDTRYCLTHGDQFKGGSGISGLLSPLMLGDARKRKRSQAINRPYDYMVMGHFHQLMQAKGVIVNGSLVGYNEYAFNNNLDFEPAQQAFWLTSLGYRSIWGFTPLHVMKKNDPYNGTFATGSREAFAAK